jgi:hypothetical protein
MAAFHCIPLGSLLDQGSHFEAAFAGSGADLEVCAMN